MIFFWVLAKRRYSALKMEAVRFSEIMTSTDSGKTTSSK
jgi:hypothetical protein